MITVIMPTLNVEPYICQCLESVQKQTMQDLEILVIDAGSTDGTIEIIKKYQEKDDRIKLFSSPVRSYGHQINMGFEMARGEYTGIVETDDVIADNMYEELWKEAVGTGADYISSDYYMLFELGEGVSWKQYAATLPGREDLYGKVIRPSDHPELICQDVHLWKGICSTGFLRKHKIRLNESPGAAYQDSGFLFQRTMLAETAVYVRQAFYQYRKNNPNSSIYNPKGFAMVMGEYDFIEAELKKRGLWTNTWITIYYRRLFDMFEARFYNMALAQTPEPEFTEAAGKLLEKVESAFRSHILDEGNVGYYKYLNFEKIRYSMGEFYRNIRYEFFMRDRLVEVLTERLEKTTEIVIFGSGAVGRFLYCLLTRHGIQNMVGFCDNNKHGKAELYGKEILSYSQARIRYPQAFYIIASSQQEFREEIRKQLEGDMGAENMYTYLLGTDYLLLI